MSDYKPKQQPRGSKPSRPRRSGPGKGGPKGPRSKKRGNPGKGGGRRKAPVKLDAEGKAKMQELMERECMRKAMARRIAAGEMTYAEFTLRYPAEYAISYRAKNLLEQNPGMTRARAFWLAEDPKRIEAMRKKQIRTFATYTGLSYELSRDIATGQLSLNRLAEQDERWAFIWTRAKRRIGVVKAQGRSLSPIEAIRWARGDYGLPFAPDEDEDQIEEQGNVLHEKYPFMKKRHTRRMARFDLDLDGLATVAPANCGWGPRALELWERYPDQHRKFIRLMAMMGLDDAEVEAFISKTEPARERYQSFAESERVHYFHLYGGDLSARFLPDNNPFAWSLHSTDDQSVKQSKLQVLFFCPNDARDAVFSQSVQDDAVVQKSLGAALAAADRLDIEVINEQLEKADSTDRDIAITLRNGMRFTGKAEWHSPFEVQLRLRNNAWLMILYHSIYNIETLTSR